MSISEEFERLEALHEAGTLTEAEFTDAKTKVLAGTASETGTQSDIRRLQLQAEILRLDQDWAEERRDYLLGGKSNSGAVPTVNSSIGSAIFLCLFALIMIIVGLNSPRGGGAEGGGLMLLAAGIWIGVYGSSKASAYNAAYEQYRVQRGELTAQLEALGGNA